MAGLVWIAGEAERSLTDNIIQATPDFDFWNTGEENCD